MSSISSAKEAGHPPARPPAEYRLERLALGLVGAFVDEEPHRRLGLAGPVFPSNEPTATAFRPSSDTSP
jgi:hypothetical protein